MTIFTIQTTLKHSDGNPKYMYVETQHTGVADLVADLRTGPVVCRKLHARMDAASNKMIVLAAKDYAIGSAIVASVEQQSLPFVEAAA